MPFSCWTDVRPAPASPFGPVGPLAPAAPAGPAAPVGPAAPAGPAGPVAPRAPAGPAGPCGPVAPFTFHEIGSSFRRQPLAPASRSLPFVRFAHALITVDGSSCREA